MKKSRKLFGTVLSKHKRESIYKKSAKKNSKNYNSYMIIVLVRIIFEKKLHSNHTRLYQCVESSLQFDVIILKQNDQMSPKIYRIQNRHPHICFYDVSFSLSAPSRFMKKIRANFFHNLKFLQQFTIFRVQHFTI